MSILFHSFVLLDFERGCVGGFWGLGFYGRCRMRMRMRGNWGNFFRGFLERGMKQSAGFIRVFFSLSLVVRGVSVLLCRCTLHLHFHLRVVDALGLPMKSDLREHWEIEEWVGCLDELGGWKGWS